MAAAAAPPANPITTPMTYAQLQALAASQAAATIGGQNAPLSAQVNTLTDQEKTAHGDVVAEQGRLLPYVQQSAGVVQQAENNALSMEQQVFAAAGTRMNQLHQNAAAEAQQLAQQMGGPVSTGQFTQALEPYENALPNVQAGGTLNALGMSLAGTQEAQQFAGQVFPAMMSEEAAKSDAFFNDQIKTLNNQIAANQGTKSDLVNTNLNTLLQNERQFQLNVTTQKRDAKAAALNEKVQRQSLADDKLRNALAQGAAKRANISLGISSAKAQASIAHMSNQDKINAAKLGITRQEAAARIAHESVMAKVGAARVSDSISKDAISLVQNAMGGGKPVSTTREIYLPNNPIYKFKPPAGAYPGKGGRYFKVVHETKPGQTGQHPITDPNRLFQYVRGSLPQLGRKATINLIRAQTGRKNWSPGQRVSFSGNDYHNMPLTELEGLARNAGYAGKFGKGNRQGIVDYLLHVNPHPGPTGQQQGAGQQPAAPAPNVFLNP
jgi:hypothetical protein